MRIAGIADPDANRSALEVLTERGIATTPFQRPRPSETWSAYAARSGLARRETARAWWDLTELVDRARGLPPDPAPDWKEPSAVERWERAPWLQEGELDSLRHGRAPSGNLHERLAPWERIETALAPLTTLPPPTTVIDLAERASQVERVLAATSGATVAGGGGTADLLTEAKTAAKYLRKGGELVLAGGQVAVKLGSKLVPVLRAANTAYKVAKFLDALAPNVDVKYLPERQYQFDSQTWIWVWPNGDVTAASPPPA